jgi:hypothetical protein
MSLSHAIHSGHFLPPSFVAGGAGIRVVLWCIYAGRERPDAIAFVSTHGGDDPAVAGGARNGDDHIARGSNKGQAGVYSAFASLISMPSRSQAIAR